MSEQGPFELVVVRDRQPRRGSARLGGATRVGNFSEQVWGVSDERHQQQHAKEWLAAPAVPTRPTETGADHHNLIEEGAGETVCVDHETASTPFVLALRAPGAAC